MKKTLIIFCVILLTVILSNKNSAQSFVLGSYTGYGMSSFEAQQSASGYLPIGLQAVYSLDKLKWGSLNFGLELNYAVSPFKFENKDSQGNSLFDYTVKQMIIAALIKVKFLKKSQFQPYARVGAGLYTGGMTIEYSNAISQQAQQQGINLPGDIDISSSFGFNIGAGANYNLDRKGNSAIFLEFVFNLVSRSLDESTAQNFNNIFSNYAQNILPTQSSGFNSWAIQIGYQMAFGG